jgi:hypothetical protein
MILDAIIGLFGSIFAVLFEGIPALVVLFVNLIAAAIDAVVGIFTAGFTVGRMQRRPTNERRNLSRPSMLAGIGLIVLVLGVGALLFLTPSAFNRKVSLVAQEGHSLPFAALIIHTNNGDRHERTDAAGNILLPRFGTNGLTIKDPRYVQRTWSGSEIEPTLTVKRTILGSGLDFMAKKLMKPAKP